jgi:hypothetical protein
MNAQRHGTSMMQLQTSAEDGPIRFFHRDPQAIDGGFAMVRS